MVHEDTKRNEYALIDDSGSGGTVSVFPAREPVDEFVVQLQFDDHNCAVVLSIEEASYLAAKLQFVAAAIQTWRGM